jgi:hypothetical protein
MICGILYVQIIDAHYGTAKHACPQYSAVAIGSESINAQGDTVVHFKATFNILDRYSKCYIEAGDSLNGSLHLTYVGDEENSRLRQILSLIPVDGNTVKICVDEIQQSKDARLKQITMDGKAVMEYTLDYTEPSNVVNVTYTLEQRRRHAYIHHINFTIGLDRLRQSQQVITNLETARIQNL